MINKKIINLALLSAFCVSLSVVPLSALAHPPKCLPIKAYMGPSFKTKIGNAWVHHLTGGYGVMEGTGTITTDIKNGKDSEEAVKDYKLSSIVDGRAHKIDNLDGKSFFWGCTSYFGSHNYHTKSKNGVIGVAVYSQDYVEGTSQTGNDDDAKVSTKQTSPQEKLMRVRSGK